MYLVVVTKGLLRLRDSPVTLIFSIPIRENVVYYL